MSAVLLRVKRKRCADPAEALLLSCKRWRGNNGVGYNEDAAIHDTDSEPVEIHNSVFKLAATVKSQDDSVQSHVREAISREKAAEALRPSVGSAQRILKDLRLAKQASRQESRYRVVSRHRDKTDGLEHTSGSNEEADQVDGQLSSTDSKLLDEEASKSQTSDGHENGEFQLFDIVQEDEDDSACTVPCSSETLSVDPDEILCNSVKMIREKLVLSKSGQGSEHREQDDEYVYDIYYMESSTPGWIQDILSVQPYSGECELVDEEDNGPQEMFEDEDDENEENNWRNDYPDENEFVDEEEADETDEDATDQDHYRVQENNDYSSEEHSDEEDVGIGYHGGRTWHKYQEDALREFDYDEPGGFDSD
ncbi:probable RNA polymerase II nuclear localization protein SLC7A6OS [Protopterus annectens]|uniref:probable RNA polymerase II nuclear localization protein SLC7A6OS n=1 Tax=Protopterus annectens TaxID=7888 RepID=UPI001CFA2B1E|nr:probable RNA polymerase II nuclear localization protein SLC7A6OS [Protopterus annectens]